MRTDYDYIVKYYLKDGSVKRDNYGDYQLCIETSRLIFECSKDIINYYTAIDCREGYKYKQLYDSRNDKKYSAD